MNKLLLLFLVLFNQGISFSQQWENVYNSFRYSPIKDVKTTNDKGLIIGSDAGINGCMHPIIFKYDSTGNIEWQKTDYELGTDAILISHDNNILFAGFNFAQDDVWGDEYFSLSKADLNGNIIFNDTINITCLYPLQIIGLNEFLNGDILIYTEDRLLKTDSAFNLIWDKDFSNVDSIKNLAIISENEFMISNTINLYKTDSNGLVLDSIALFHSAFLINDDTIYLCQQNKVYTLDSNLSMIDTIDLSGYFSEIHQIIWQSPDYWIKGLSATGTIIVHKVSSAFQLINSYEIPTDKIDSTAILCVENDKFILASERLGQCAISYFDQDLFSIDNTLSDIQPENLSIDNIHLDYYNYGGQLYQIGFYFDAHVSIKNNGADTVKSLALYSIQNGFMNCSLNYDYSIYTNVSIPPNQSVNLDFLHIYEMLPLDSQNYHYCLLCLAPDSLIETNISNNSICGDFFIVSADEMVNSNSISLFPNPTINEINVTVPYDILPASMTIYDIFGKACKEIMTESGTVQINVSELPKGVYMVKVQSDSRVITNKIVKE